MYGMPVCKTQYRVRDFNGLSSQDLGGSFTLPGLWIYEGPQANGMGRGTEMEQANSLLGRRGFHY